MFRYVTYALVGLTFASMLPTGQAVAQPNRAAYMQPGDPGSCPAVQPKGDVVILSMYGGSGQQAPYSFEGTQHQVSIVKVTADKNKRDKVTLVLTAYESTVWDLSDIKDRIAGIMVYGYYPQGISGIPKSIPAVFQTVTGPENIRVSSNSICFPGYVHSDMYKIQRQAKSVQAILGGVHPRRWYGGYKPAAFNIDGGSAKAPTPVPASSVRTNVPIKIAGLMPGNEGLEQLVQAGVLRRFSKNDVNAWSARGAEMNMIGGPMMAHQGQHDPIEYVGTANSGYLLLKNLGQVPEGLGGANSVIFVVPEGLSMPMTAGHSTIYRLSNYPGKIPPPGQFVPIDVRAQMIGRSDNSYAAANIFVEWDRNGNVTKNGTTSGSRPILPNVERPAGIDPDTYQNPTDGQFEDGQSTDNQESTNSSSSSALIIILILIVFAAGAAAAFWYMRKRSEEAKEQEDPDELQLLLNDLDRVIEACDDDATSLSVSRFKRLLIKAMNEAEFDDDLADELERIAYVHIPNYTKSYLAAVKLGKDSNIEIKMRQTIDKMSHKVEGIIAEQRSRYRDKFDVNDNFVNERHN